ncbi:hypothetical protein RHMOL_Rhmol08G0199100 [Rhododendron molle]|uniref:Uncharacterized protein n=1 Tax=Rhododendron molle TaxID=49168 RepID=A0ACC0MRR1_RHOML|nr:hypothetical protein RHMOL_Rhmol08G0199100 [Rhododendron molle]
MDGKRKQKWMRLLRYRWKRTQEALAVMMERGQLCWCEMAAAESFASLWAEGLADDKDSDKSRSEGDKEDEGVER